jgi:hypothetical protein
MLDRMTLLGIIAVLAATGWIGWSIERRFQRHTYPTAWKVAAGVLGLCGVALGIWLLTREYFVSPTVRLAGYPFPIGGYEIIGGRWSGGLASPYAPLVLIADIAAGVGICLLPLRIAQFIFERRTTHESTPNAA